MGRRFVCSDLHGCLDFYIQVKDFIAKDDIVYCLGDCGDRGPHEWETIKAIMNDPQFVYIKGNHEDMLVQAMKEYNRGVVKGEDWDLVACNGGHMTFAGWRDEGADMSWAWKLEDLPLRMTIINDRGQEVILCHAGYTPGADDENWNTENSDEKEVVLWDRVHYVTDYWDEKNYPNTIVVHGHTPIPHLDEDREFWDCSKFLSNATDKEMANGAYWYANNHKVCIDSGMCFTEVGLLLDIDTWDCHVFNVSIKE